MNEVPWEQTADGVQARMVRNVEYIRKSGLLLKETAVAKMLNVSLISAEFEGTPVVFEPNMWVYLDMGETAEFMGFYQSAFPFEEDEHDVPSYCLRRSLWMKDCDFEQLNLAKNKKAYITGEKQVSSKIVFTSPAACPDISHLTEELSKLIWLGVRLDAAERSDTYWREIRIEATNGSTSYSLSYFPPMSKSEHIEGWIAKWQQLFSKIGSETGHLPDNGCSISYSLSLMELLAMFPG